MQVKVHKQRSGRGDVTYYVRIPKHLYQALGEPEAFELKIEEGKIVLIPMKHPH